MPVMGVAPMGVGMLQRFVVMGMGVPERLIGGHAVHLLRCVVVVVMGIHPRGAVPMAVGVEQILMAMPVAVLLPQEQHHASGHQASRHQQLR